ncbi:MAG: peptidoglycan-binding domain-containing protein, partial [Desulfobacteraceae bacterium]
WGLELPLTIRGIRIDEEVLGQKPVRASAQDVEERLLYLQSPNMRGDDVRQLQQALANAGLEVEVDGIFGQQTSEAVKKFQQQNDLTVDGIVGPATLAALAIE